MKFFEMSIMEDKNYAKAYSGLADCYAFIGNYMIADSKEAFMNAVKYARKAIELDPMLGEHTLLWELFWAHITWILMRQRRK